MRECLQGFRLGTSSSRASSNSHKGKKKKDSKSSKRKEKKKKSSRGRSRRRRSSSGSSSRSSSTNSSGSSDRYPRWVPPGGKRLKYDKDALNRAEILHFRKRKDLLTFSSRYPGALGAHFLLQVRRKLFRPTAENSKELRETDPTIWAVSQTEMKDVRDLKECHFLTKLLLELNQDRLSCMRM